MKLIGGHRARIEASLFAAGLIMAAIIAAPAKAQEDAVIRNLAFSRVDGADVGAEASVVAVDGLPVGKTSAEVRLPAGMRSIEVNCAASVFAGMGRVRLEHKSVLTSQIEAGRIYQLQARVSAQGDCTPVLE